MLPGCIECVHIKIASYPWSCALRGRVGYHSSLDAVGFPGAETGEPFRSFCALYLAAGWARDHCDGFGGHEKWNAGPLVERCELPGPARL